MLLDNKHIVIHGAGGPIGVAVAQVHALDERGIEHHADRLATEVSGLDICFDAVVLDTAALWRSAHSSSARRCASAMEMPSGY